LHCIPKKSIKKFVKPLINMEKATNDVVRYYPFTAAWGALALCQIIKFFFVRYKEKRWDSSQLVRFGGMPSSQAALVSSLAYAVGFHEGFGGPTYAIILLLGIIVIYNDIATEERQAAILQEILIALPAENPLSESTPPHEVLKQSFYRVFAGIVVGVLTAGIGHIIILRRLKREIGSL
jgi:uncharacterized protein